MSNGFLVVSSCASLPVLEAEFLGEFVDPPCRGPSLGSSCWWPPFIDACVSLVGAGVSHLPRKGPFLSCCRLGYVLDLRDASEPCVAALVVQPDACHSSLHPALGDGELLPRGLSQGFASVQQRRQSPLPLHLDASGGQERAILPECVPSAADPATDFCLLQQHRVILLKCLLCCLLKKNFEKCYNHVLKSAKVHLKFGSKRHTFD